MRVCQVQSSFIKIFAINALPSRNYSCTKRSSRKSKLCEIKAVSIYDGKIALRVLDEYDLQDSFQKRINPGSRELPAHNTTVACEHDNSGSEFKK